MNNRRKLILGLGAFGILGALPVGAQSTAKARVGLLYGELDWEVVNFRHGMHELGYVEGENIQYFLKSPKGQLEMVSAITSEFINRGARAIVLGSISSAQAARKVSPTLPIVLIGASDPVAAGLAMNLARPGYNVTGLINLYDELAKKHIEMIKELLPKMRRVGVLAVDTIPASRVAETIRGAAQQLKIETVVSKVGSPEKSAQGLQRLKEATVSAVIVLTSPTLMAARQSIVDSAAQLRMPMITTDREYTELGGLISYGANRAELAYLAASYVDKILKGASAGDLPIQQPTKFEMVVNLKTAKALGIKIPNSILVRADKVIE